MRPRGRSLALIALALLGFAALGVAWRTAVAPVESWTDIAYEGAGDPAVEELGSSDGSSGADRRTVPPEAPRRAVLDSDAPSAAPSAVHRVVAEELGFPLQVVEKATGAPLAGASVLFFDTLSARHAAFRRAQKLYQRDREAALQRHGELVRSDARGVAILPHGIPTQEVAVRHGALYGEVRVSLREAPPAGYRVELEPDRSILVQTLDAAGKPIDDVGLAVHFGLRDPKNGGFRWVLIQTPDRVADRPEGIHTLAHVQSRVELLKRLSGGPALVHLGVALPGATRCGPQLDVEDPPRELVKLSVPSWGSVAVRVVDADGAPVQRRVRLSADPDFPVANLDARAAEAMRPHWERHTDSQGVVVFPRVAIGRRYRVASVGADVERSESVEIDGPSEPGRAVEVELRRAFRAARLSGIARSREGTLVNTRIHYRAVAQQVDAVARYLVSGTVETDASGRFEIRLPPSRRGVDGKGRPLAANLYRGLHFEVTGAELLRPQGEVTLPAELAVGPHELGAIELARPVPVVRGRVFVEDQPARHFDRLVVEGADPQQPQRWQRITDLQLRTRRGGEFVVLGDPRGRALRLQVRSWGYLPVPPIPFTAGQEDLEVRLRTAGMLRAAVLHDPEAAQAHFDVRLRPIAVDPDLLTPQVLARLAGNAHAGSSGNRTLRTAYLWATLPPGTYRLEVRLLGDARPILLRDGVTPRFGVPLSEVEPEILNLRDVLQRVCVRTRDARGRPVRALVVPLQHGVVEGIEAIPTGRDGAVLHTARRGVDVKVIARGYRTQVLTGVVGVRDVTMEPGIPVVVTLPGMRLPRGTRVAVKLIRHQYRPAESYTFRVRDSSRPRAGARPLADLLGERGVTLRYRGRRQWKGTLAEPGTFRLVVLLLGRGGTSVRVTGVQPQVIELTERAEVQPFTVTIKRGHVERGVRELQAKIDKLPAKSAKRPG
ncbi:MAG: hypothetical protein H6836_06045 [Planctomycetes bacterium]|nr:hypothetical protein [Planctomycetota bacterium]MCB9889121.1 hypothetical protein [Planctomycetota bacterium]